MGEKGVAMGAGAGAGAALFKSVSIFLMTGRKTTTKSPPSAAKKRGRATMPDTSTSRKYTSTVKVLESLKKKTKFSGAELDKLCKLYKQLIGNSLHQQVSQSISTIRRTQSRHTAESIDRAIFREFLHNTFDMITEDTLTERIFCCWDRENEGIIRLEPWILGLDGFLRGNLKDRVAFCFKVYDLNNDGFIAKDEILQLLKNCLIRQPGEEDPDEGVRDLSEMILKKMDADRDGKISFSDYKTAVKQEPLLLEAFGQCLPTEENTFAFLSTLRS